MMMMIDDEIVIVLWQWITTSISLRYDKCSKWSNSARVAAAFWFL